MIRAALAIGFGAFIVWNIQALDNVEKSLVELVISGKIPGTEAYLSLTATLALLLFVLIFLARWIFELFEDFLDFSWEYSRAEQAKRQELLAQQEVTAVEETAESLGDEELDLLSV